MKVTVTGAAGHVGSHVVRALVAAGHDVLATDRRPRHDLPVPVRVADLLEQRACYDLVDGRDWIVHLGNHPRKLPDVNWQDTYGQNMAMDVNVFHAAVERGVRRFIFASSIMAMAGRRHTRDGPNPSPSQLAYLPIDGDAPQNPGSLYALSKAAGEQMLQFYVRFHDCRAVAVRFPLMIDVEQDRWRSKPRVPDYGGLDQGFAYLDVRDAGTLVAAIVRADLPGYRCYLPATRVPVNGRPVRELIAEYYPAVPLKRPIDQIDSLVDTTRITRETGWEPMIE